MKKRFIVLSAAALLALSALSGCGGNNSANANETTTVEAVEENGQSSGEMANIDDVVTLLDKANELEKYMQNGVSGGTISKERMTEFGNLTARLNEIIASGTAPADEVNEIRETLAAMASQASAPNDLIDYFVTAIDGEKSEKTEDEIKAEEENANLPTDVKKLIDDFNNLSNEASQKVDKGEIDMETYTDLLQKGIEIAQIKEELESGGSTDELVKKADDIKPYIYDIAVKMDSKLKDNFK